MNFEKTEISSKVIEFLEINLTQEEDKKSFASLHILGLGVTAI